MFEIKLRLSEAEVQAYREQGKPYLDALAGRIAYSPEHYRQRWIAGA